MKIPYTISEAWADINRLGFKFAVDAFSERFGSGEATLQIGNRKIYIRRKNSDLSCIRQVLRDFEYRIISEEIQRNLFGEYKKVIESGFRPVIVDAGANIGAASIWFSELYPLASVVAIEPDQSNAALLRRNLAGVPGSIVIEAAVGGAAGHVATQWADGDGWAIQTERANTGIPIVTIADAVAMIPNAKLFIAKIDIEGFEDDLFSKNTEWIDKAEAIFVEPHDWMFPDRSTSRNFQTELAKRNFNILISGENLVYIRNRNQNISNS